MRIRGRTFAGMAFSVAWFQSSSGSPDNPVARNTVARRCASNIQASACARVCFSAWVVRGGNWSR